MSEKSVAFFERGSWYHRVKILNEDYSVKYSKIGGFKTEEEAVESYWKCDKAFKMEYTTHHISCKKDIMLGDYLIYWFEKVYSNRIETTTLLGTAYAIYNLILPNIKQDIKLNLVSVEYFNALLKEVSKSSPSAGNKCREVLSIAMKDAKADGYIIYNPIPETTPYKRKKSKITILSKEQIKILLALIQKTNWYLETLLALFCGLRKGEILGLKFSDFDLERQTVSISRQLVKNPKLKKGIREGVKVEECTLIERDPKSIKGIRTLKVPKVIMIELQKRKEVIEMYKEQYIDFEDNDYISCQLKTGKPHSLSSLNIFLNRICNPSPLPNISVHRFATYVCHNLN